MKATAAKIKAFAAKAPQREAEARALLKTAPGVGVVTAEVVLSELGDVSRFKNAKAVCAYAGLVPVVRQTGGKKAKDGHITKAGLRACCVGPWWSRPGGWSRPASAVVGHVYDRIKTAERRQAGGGGGGAGSCCACSTRCSAIRGGTTS